MGYSLADEIAPLDGMVATAILALRALIGHAAIIHNIARPENEKKNYDS